MSNSQYPDSFPIDEVRKIVGFVKDGVIKNNIADAAYSVWVVQGYAQSALIGKPNVVSINPDFTLQSVPDESSAQDILESLATDQPSAQIAIPWEIVLPYLLQLLQMWLSKKTV